MPTFHKLVGGALIAAFFVLFVWGTLFWIRNKDPGPGFWGLLAVGQVAIGIQVVAGIILLAMGNRRPWLHYSYGGFAVLVLYVAHRVAKKFVGVEWAVFGIASLFVTGLLIRGYMTGIGMG